MLKLNIKNVDPPSQTTQKIYLGKLQSDLQNFNEDRIHLIETYLDKTGFYSNLLPVLVDVRHQLVEKDNPSLYGQFTHVKADLIDYIKLKVDRLNKRGATQDPWHLVLEKLHDALLACKLVVLYGMQEGVATTREDLEDLIEQISKKYIPLFKNEAKNHPSRANFMQDINAQLIELATFLKRPDDPKVLLLIQKIQDSLEKFGVRS